MQSTVAMQFAEYVVLYSPIQMLSNYSTDPSVHFAVADARLTTSSNNSTRGDLENIDVREGWQETHAIIPRPG